MHTSSHEDWLEANTQYRCKYCAVDEYVPVPFNKFVPPLNTGVHSVPSKARRPSDQLLNKADNDYLLSLNRESNPW
jgi:hypothetical protein